MTLTKDHLINTIAKENGFLKKRSAEIVETLTAIIKSSLASGDDVLVSGFGKFCVKEKHEVSTAYNGLDGIKEFDKSDGCLDLVITDLVMPEISGVGVISVIKMKSPKLPVIAMTGWGECPGALARDAKADLVLNKPFELEDLDRHVAELLARKS